MLWQPHVWPVQNTKRKYFTDFNIFYLQLILSLLMKSRSFHPFGFAVTPKSPLVQEGVNGGQKKLLFAFFLCRMCIKLRQPLNFFKIPGHFCLLLESQCQKSTKNSNTMLKNLVLSFFRYTTIFPLYFITCNSGLSSDNYTKYSVLFLLKFNVLIHKYWGRGGEEVKIGS